MRKLIVGLAILLAGCGEDKFVDRVASAEGDTKVKYVICSDAQCFVAARFNDLESCERHKEWSGMLCTRSEPGTMICSDPVGSPLADGYCTL